MLLSIFIYIYVLLWSRPYQNPDTSSIHLYNTNGTTTFQHHNNKSLVNQSGDIEVEDRYVLLQLYINRLSSDSSPTKKIELSHAQALRVMGKETSHLPMYKIKHVQESQSETTARYSYLKTIHNRKNDEDHSYPYEPLLLPMPTDKETILNLAKMSYNSYIPLNETSESPYNMTDPFSYEEDFGWIEDGLRGYIYTNPRRSIVIIAIKGTSAALFSRNGTTIVRDKYNDNLMFSCCCAKVDFTWSPICPCYQGGHLCNQTCIKEHMSGMDSYYTIANEIYQQVKDDFPRATIWLTGHSLGGALASLVTLSHLDRRTVGVAFGSPGERLFAQRIGLVPFSSMFSLLKENSEYDLYLESMPIYHYYHTADPIPFGQCTGKLSSCYYAGYAMETACHVGKQCIYDLKNLRFDISKHKIKYFIEAVINASESVPLCLGQKMCVDCVSWNFTSL